ncbi:MAG: isoprenylcysteine carboxylmethyltransferase family protein [Anaerolineales bacterium]
MNNSQSSQGELIKMVFVRFLGAILVLSAMFFLPAGTLAYWEAWGYLAILFIPMLFVLFYLLKNDPGLLARRMKTREREAEQKLIIKLSFIPFLLAFLLPGFDKRFGWSNVPVGMVVMSDILVLLGYGIVFLVFRENRYASRVVEVEQEQTVISSGPYAMIRHPMYLGSLLLYILSPLALGSYWAMIPAILIIPVIIARIRNEESVLARDLSGYQEYMQKTRYRLIPGMW